MKTSSFIKGVLLIAFPLFLISAVETGIFEGICDVGNPTLKGGISYNKATDTYSLTGAGANIWGKTDEFFFAWKKVTGDFSMSTKLSFEGVNPE
ncbi:MAG: hypothetical protein LBL58_02640, partial [Tannerellaceae bacterium]|nr:hypothetical protein [Tannerellaceae bacterium]